MINTKKQFKYSFIIGILIFLTVSSQIEMISGAAAEGVNIDNGESARYKYSATAAYRIYTETGHRLNITVTDNSVFPVLGDVNVVKFEGRDHDDDDETDEIEKWWVDRTTQDVALVPYIMDNLTIAKDFAKNPGNITQGGNCPLLGSNTSRSYIADDWDENNFEYPAEEQEFADALRMVVEFTYIYQSEKDTGEDNETIDYEIVLTWDLQYGLLLRQSLTVNNLDNPDYALNGQLNITIEETSLWQLDTGVPGYPLVAFSISIAIGIISIIAKKNHKKGGDM